MKRLATYFTVTLLFLSGCSENELQVLVPEEFFPLQKGFYQVYDVLQINYSPFNPPETLAYELKSEIVDSFNNAEGGMTYVIHRSTRDTEGEPWLFRETWSARMDDQAAVVTEGNTSFIKLIFPLIIGTRWNGNRFNSLAEDFYLLEKFENPYSPEAGITFDKSFIVNQNNESNLVNRDQRIEVYAAGLGLVYKESQVWSYNCLGGNCTGQIASGYYLKQTLKGHGQL